MSFSQLGLAGWMRTSIWDSPEVFHWLFHIPSVISDHSTSVIPYLRHLRGSGNARREIEKAPCLFGFLLKNNTTFLIFFSQTGGENQLSWFHPYTARSGTHVQPNPFSGWSQWSTARTSWVGTSASEIASDQYNHSQSKLKQRRADFHSAPSFRSSNNYKTVSPIG